MKLLIITQKVDKGDPILGFFHRWLEEFAKKCDQLTVICLEKGEYDLPENIKVLSLGKETGRSRLKFLWRFYKYLWQERKNYDAVFVHMNPVYLVLAGWWWRLNKKYVSLWYVHRQVDVKLRLSVIFANVVFSAAPESFRLKTNKLKIVGHGIDVTRFMCDGARQGDVIKIGHIGRITRIKNCDVLIKALPLLVEQLGVPTGVIFIGEPVTSDDQLYYQELLKMATDLKIESNVEFLGALKQDQLPVRLCELWATANLTPTGGLDKAVIESMVAGRPVFISNKAFEPHLGKFAGRLVFKYRNHVDLASKIIAFYQAEDQGVVCDSLQKMAVETFSVEKVTTLMLKYINEASR